MAKDDDEDKESAGKEAPTRHFNVYHDRCLTQRLRDASDKADTEKFVLSVNIEDIDFVTGWGLMAPNAKVLPSTKRRGFSSEYNEFDIPVGSDGEDQPQVGRAMMNRSGRHSPVTVSELETMGLRMCVEPRTFRYVPNNGRYRSIKLARKLGVIDVPRKKATAEKLTPDQRRMQREIQRELRREFELESLHRAADAEKEERGGADIDHMDASASFSQRSMDEILKSGEAPRSLSVSTFELPAISVPPVSTSPRVSSTDSFTNRINDKRDQELWKDRRCDTKKLVSDESVVALGRSRSEPPSSSPVHHTSLDLSRLQPHTNGVDGESKMDPAEAYTRKWIFADRHDHDDVKTLAKTIFRREVDSSGQCPARNNKTVPEKPQHLTYTVPISVSKMERKTQSANLCLDSEADRGASSMKSKSSSMAHQPKDDANHRHDTSERPTPANDFEDTSNPAYHRGPHGYEKDFFLKKISESVQKSHDTEFGIKSSPRLGKSSREISCGASKARTGSYHPPNVTTPRASPGSSKEPSEKPSHPPGTAGPGRVPPALSHMPPTSPSTKKPVRRRLEPEKDVDLTIHPTNSNSINAAGKVVVDKFHSSPIGQSRPREQIGASRDGGLEDGTLPGTQPMLPTISGQRAQLAVTSQRIV